MLTGGSTSGLVRNNATGVALRTNTTDRLIIDSSGNVGIGSTNPIQKLTVAGNIDIAGGNGSLLTFNNGDAKIVINNNGSGRDLSFQTYDGSSTAERMRILSTGQVKFNNYTSSSSFTGTAEANLAVDSSGNIITEASGGGGGGTKTVSTVASVAAGVSTHALGVSVTTTPTVNYVDLYISGVYQSKTSYTVSGNTLTLTGATFPTGALIETVTTT